MTEAFWLPGQPVQRTAVEQPADDLDNRIVALFQDGVWRLCSEVAIQLGVTDMPKVKTRLRQPNIRGRAVHVRRRSDGTYEYQLEGMAT